MLSVNAAVVALKARRPVRRVAPDGAMWNLRGFITSEIKDATAATSASLETAVSEIREEIRAGRESRNRQMAEIREFMSSRRTRLNESPERAPGNRRADGGESPRMHIEGPRDRGNENPATAELPQ